MTTQSASKGVELPSFNNNARRRTFSNGPSSNPAQAKLNNYLSKERENSKPKGIPLKINLPPQRMSTNQDSTSVQRNIKTMPTNRTSTQNKNSIDMSFKVDEAAKSRNGAAKSKEKRKEIIPPLRTQDFNRQASKDDQKKVPLRATLSGDRTTTRERPAYRISTDNSSNSRYKKLPTRTIENSELQSSRLPGGDNNSICVAELIANTGTMPSSFVKISLQNDENDDVKNVAQIKQNPAAKDTIYSTIERVSTQNPDIPSAKDTLMPKEPKEPVHLRVNFHGYPGKRKLISFFKGKPGQQPIKAIADKENAYNKQTNENDEKKSHQNEQEGEDIDPLQSIMNGKKIRQVSFPAEDNATSTIDPSPRNDITQDTITNITSVTLEGSPERESTEIKKDIQIRITKKRPTLTMKKSLGLKNRNKPKGLVGLKNMGNTCFMNAVLQCLFNTPIFSDYFMSGNHNEEKNAQHQGLADSFSNLLGKVKKYSTYPVTEYEVPAEFKNCLARVNSIYSGYNQHDAPEFLGIFLEGINQDLNRVITKPSYEDMVADPHRSLQEISNEFYEQMMTRDNSIVTDVFSGQLLSKKTCGSCNSVSIMFDNFWDLALSFEKIPSDSQHLYEMLERFLAEETLEELVYCRKCDRQTKSKKKFVLWRLPKVLVVQIKRFEIVRTRQSKINKSIVFPVKDLDLSKFTKESGDSSVEDSHYTLYGVVNHGGSLNGGHYTAECLNAYNRKWYNYNDASVEETTMESTEAESSFPYVLFYVKSSYFN